MHLPADEGFTDEQKQYLDGFVSGAGIVRSLDVLPTWQKTLGLADQPRPAERNPMSARNRFCMVMQGCPGRSVLCCRHPASQRGRAPPKKHHPQPWP